MSLLEYNKVTKCSVQGGFSDMRIWYCGALISFGVLTLGLFMNLLTSAVLLGTPTVLGAFVIARRQNNNFLAARKTRLAIDRLYKSLELQEAAWLLRSTPSQNVLQAKMRQNNTSTSPAPQLGITSS